MASPAQNSTPLKPWERRPWPAAGDTDITKIFASVGKFLSQWERYEGMLSLLFAAFVSQPKNDAARRAYVSVRTFEGRAEMLRAASAAYFHVNPNEAAQSGFKSVLKGATCFSPRRNDIAHGLVDRFFPQVMQPGEAFDISYALYPSYASFKERDLQDQPGYCYSSVELEYFYTQIIELTREAADLGTLF